MIKPNRNIRLKLARFAWIVIAVTAIGMFIAGAPYAIDAYSHVGTFLTSGTMASLQAQGISPQWYARVMVTAILVSGLIWALVGILIFVRKPDDWLALVVSLALVTWGTNTMLRGALAQALPVFSLPFQVLILISWSSLALFFALFPSGYFVPRWLSGVVFVWLIILVLPKDADVIPEAITGMFFLAFWAILLSAQIYRYFRVSTRPERQQTKWVLFGVGLLFAIYIPLFIFMILVPDIVNSPFLLVFANSIPVIIPISVGIAILRSRLWDIDVIIRKTLVYSVLTALLALIYFGGVVLVQQLTRSITETSDLAIVISTLAIAALFFPLRRRVQNAIDRRFYRRKYDARKVLERFAATARDEVELDELTSELLNVVNETMQPTHVSLWLKK